MLTESQQSSTVLKEYEIVPIQHISSSRLTELREHPYSAPDLQQLRTVILKGWPHRETQLPDWSVLLVRRQITIEDVTVTQAMVPRGNANKPLTHTYCTNVPRL